MTVELNVYSGRPNPAWELSENERAELVARLKDLPVADAAISDAGLGYRGFVILKLGRTGELPRRIRVYGGIVAMENGGHPRFYRDTHEIEPYLLEQAAGRGYGAIVEGILPKQP